VQERVSLEVLLILIIHAGRLILSVEEWRLKYALSIKRGLLWVKKK
jgi:hypothetical protein